jgi:hypothetical protein
LFSTHIDKLSSELESIKKSQNSQNDQNKNEQKSILNEIENIKQKILSFQSNLSNQTSEIKLLEKEVNVFKKSGSCPINYDFNEMRNKDGLEIKNSLSQDFDKKLNMEENMNFLIVVILIFYQSVKISRKFNKYRKRRK